MSASVPAPESFSMDCDLKCDMCSESVNYGDDYIAHLRIVHQINKNIPFFLEKALATIKGEKRKGKVSDVVTLEEEEDDTNVRTDDADERDTDGDSQTERFVLDEATKSNIEKAVERTMDDLFKDIKLMVEGKMPLEVDENSEEVLEDEDPYAADEKIWQSFENLKEIVNNMEFPPELIRELSSSRSVSTEVTNNKIEERNDPEVTNDEREVEYDIKKVTNDEIEEPLSELPPSAPQLEIKKFRKPQTKRNTQTSDKENLNILPPRVETHKSKPSPKSALAPASMNPTNGLLPTNLAPIKSDRSDRSTASSTGKPSLGQTFFLCPIENCSFSTTKQGMIDGAAANHLSKTHKVTGKDMKNAAPGTYKFKKVKSESKT